MSEIESELARQSMCVGDEAVPRVPSWNDLPLPPDPRDAEIAALKARVEALERQVGELTTAHNARPLLSPRRSLYAGGCGGSCRYVRTDTSYAVYECTRCGKRHHFRHRSMNRHNVICGRDYEGRGP